MDLTDLSLLASTYQLLLKWLILEKKCKKWTATLSHWLTYISYQWRYVPHVGECLLERRPILRHQQVREGGQFVSSPPFISHVLLPGTHPLSGEQRASIQSRGIESHSNRRPSAQETCALTAMPSRPFPQRKIVNGKFRCLSIVYEYTLFFL